MKFTSNKNYIKAQTFLLGTEQLFIIYNALVEINQNSAARSQPSIG